MRLFRVMSDSVNASDASTVNEPTGLPNRAFFVAKVTEMFEDSLRRGDALSLMRVRVDAFDPIIARHERSARDDIRRKIARTIEGMIQIDGRIPVDDDIISATIRGGVSSRIDDGSVLHFELIESSKQGLAGAKTQGPNTLARPPSKARVSPLS